MVLLTHCMVVPMPADAQLIPAVHWCLLVPSVHWLVLPGGDGCTMMPGRDAVWCPLGMLIARCFSLLPATAHWYPLVPVAVQFPPVSAAQCLDHDPIFI